MTKRSLSKYKDLKAEREIASFKSGHKWDYWCVRTSRYDHHIPGASIQILRCLEKDLLFLNTEIKWSLEHAFHLPLIWNKVHLIGDLSILLTGADYRTTTPPMKNIARNK